MPKRISIITHLTIDELEQRYRQASHPIERSHYQIIWLLAQGRTTSEVASVTGYSRDWIYELVRSYNCLGVEALGDLRRTNPGGTPKLDDVQQAQLLEPTFRTSICSTTVVQYQTLPSQPSCA